MSRSGRPEPNQSGWRQAAEREGAPRPPALFTEKLVDAWYRGAWWLWSLRPLEILFRLFVRVRRGCYARGLFPVYRAPVPVVVVGNITVGGTGKTPVVIALVESLQQRGISVGVVSRGYGARDLKSPRRVDDSSPAGDCGDEPLLIRRRTGCPCVVAPDRAEAVRALLAGDPVDVIISDDAMQHYGLARDMEIAVFDRQRGMGNGFCLPAGPLREPATRLQEVDYVLYRDGADPASALGYEALCLVNLASGRQCPPQPATLPAEINAVAGIGQPGQFFASLRGLGFEPRQRVFADHHNYNAADFAGLADRPIIMTEKDAVKCAGLAGDDAWYLKIAARLPPAVTDAVVALARP